MALVITIIQYPTSWFFYLSILIKSIFSNTFFFSFFLLVLHHTSYNNLSVHLFQKVLTINTFRTWLNPPPKHPTRSDFATKSGTWTSKVDLRYGYPLTSPGRILKAPSLVGGDPWELQISVYYNPKPPSPPKDKSK